MGAVQLAVIVTSPPKKPLNEGANVCELLPVAVSEKVGPPVHPAGAVCDTVALQLIVAPDVTDVTVAVKLGIAGVAEIAGVVGEISKSMLHAG